MTVSMKLPKQDNYEVAFRLAKDELLAADLDERCRNSGAELKSESSLELKYFNRMVTIELPEVTMKYESGRGVPLWEQILILHYINKSSGGKPTGDMISFKEIPAGEFYYEAFKKRGLKKLTSVFGKRPEMLVVAGEALGGERTAYGDCSVQISALPNVPVMFVVWEGDEELPPSGNILFDQNISEYLVTEDVAVLSGLAVGKLVRVKSGPEEMES